MVMHTIFQEVMTTIKNKISPTKKGKRQGKCSMPSVPNVPICTVVRLPQTLQCNCGATPYNLMAKYQISYTDMMNNIWIIVDAVNTLDEFRIEYLGDHSIQESKNGLQVTLLLLVVQDLQIAQVVWVGYLKMRQRKYGLTRNKLYCGRKDKFGLNCQAGSDIYGQFCNISIAC